MLTAILTSAAIGYSFAVLRQPLHSAAHWLGRYGLFLLTIAWWATAIRRYLHIPHGWAVATMLAILLAVLLAAGVMRLTDFLQ